MSSTSNRKGRIAKSEYSNVEEIVIAHTELKAGDPCPIAYCTGKLYKLKPSAIFKIDGASFACPINYSIDRLRCALCGEIQKPAHDIPQGKYTDKFTSQLILHKYFLALPLYRLDGYQKIGGVPLPNSTGWDIIDDKQSVHWTRRGSYSKCLNRISPARGGTATRRHLGFLV